MPSGGLIEPNWPKARSLREKTEVLTGRDRTWSFPPKNRENGSITMQEMLLKSGQVRTMPDGPSWLEKGSKAQAEEEDGVGKHDSDKPGRDRTGRRGEMSLPWCWDPQMWHSCT